MSDEIGTGELARAVALIRGDITTLAAALATRPDKEDLRTTAAALESKQLALREISELRSQIQDRAIKDLEDWQTWALRLGAPTLLAAVAGVVFNGSRIS